MSETLSISVTEKAREKFRAALDEDGPSSSVVRVVVTRPTPIRYQYALDIIDADAREPGDVESLIDGIPFRVDGVSAGLLGGATIDYELSLKGAGFKFTNPSEPKGWSDPIAARLQRLFDEEINPGLAGHGGNVTLLEYAAGRAVVEMGGGCQGCGMAGKTLREGIEVRVKEAIPEVKELVDSTNHAAGEAPYFLSQG